MTDQQAIRLGARVDTLIAQRTQLRKLADELAARAQRPGVPTAEELDDDKMADALRSAAAHVHHAVRMIEQRRTSGLR